MYLGNFNPNVKKRVDHDDEEVKKIERTGKIGHFDPKMSTEDIMKQFNRLDLTNQKKFLPNLMISASTK